jgi:hypothetical protein
VGQAGVEQLTPGDDDDVEPRCDLVPTKNLSYQSFGSVPLNGSAELPGGRDPEAARRLLVRQHEHRAEAAMDSHPALVDPLKIGAAADPFGLAEFHLFAADREAFPPFGPPALQHQTAVFRAHSDQKAVRTLAMARIRLKRALAFHRSLRSVRWQREPSMVTNAFEGCQCEQTVLQSPAFAGLFQPRQSHDHSVCPQSFPHLWKKLWKIAGKPELDAAVEPDYSNFCR